jgi:hypothetical protein
MQGITAFFGMRISRIIMLLGFLVGIWYTAASPFFDFDKVQAGREYGVHITSLYAWEHVKSCGMCVFWENNSGGAPLFGDPYTSAQHPFVIIATILTNPIAAGNLTVAFSLALMGLAGLLYAQTFKYELVPSLWLIAMLVWGGHLITRLDVGSIGLPLSIASFTLSIVLIIRWMRNPTLIAGLLVALSVAGLGVSGQGYMQFLFIFSLIPLFIYAQKFMPFRQLIINGLGIGVIAMLMILPFLVSYMQYGDLMHKHGSRELDSVQPFGYFFLNLLVDQRELFDTTVLSKQSFVYLYSNYVGYVTVILAAIALFATIFVTTTSPQPDKDGDDANMNGESKFIGLWLSIAFICALLVSGSIQRFIFWLNLETLNEIAGFLRNVVIVGCTVAIVIIFMSGYGLRVLLARINQLGDKASMRISTHVVSFNALVYVLLIWQLLSVQSYVKQYINLNNVDQDSLVALKYLDQFPRSYVGIENNEQYLNVLNSNHKNVWNLFYPYQYKNKINITAKYLLAYSDVDLNEGWVEIKKFDDLHVYVRDTYETAYSKLTMLQEDATIRCPIAKGSAAGKVVLTCTLDQGDTLLVTEYNFPGWTAYIDGKPVDLYSDLFLMVDVPAGTHTITFQYLPLAVIVSAFISLIAWVASISVVVWLWIRRPRFVIDAPEPPSIPA